MEVYERLDRCGGRAHIIEDQGFRFDTGPSFVLMPEFFKEVFTDCGAAITDYLDLRILPTSYKITYADGDVLTVYQDSQKTRAELERFEPGAGARLDEFIRQTAQIYQAVHPLLYKCFTPRDLLAPRYWDLLFRLRPFETYWQLARRFFKNEKICYAMTFEAMFIGVSPFRTPAFYSVISYTDHVEKIAHPMGGMYQVPLALERLGRERGVRYHYGAEVTSVRPVNGGVVLNVGGQEVAADQVVLNADYAHAQHALLGRRLPRYQYSCSVYLLYLGLKTRVPGLEHHNLFFARDLRRNLREIFQSAVLSADPSFYVHVPTVTDPGLAPEGKDIAYILVPVPNLERSTISRDFLDETMRAVVFEQIRVQTGIDLADLIEVEHRFYPQDFLTRYQVQHGATFGLAHTLLQSAFFPAGESGSPQAEYLLCGGQHPARGRPAAGLGQFADRRRPDQRTAGLTVRGAARR